MKNIFDNTDNLDPIEIFNKQDKNMITIQSYHLKNNQNFYKKIFKNIINLENLVKNKNAEKEIEKLLTENIKIIKEDNLKENLESYETTDTGIKVLYYDKKNNTTVEINYNYETWIEQDVKLVNKLFNEIQKIINNNNKSNMEYNIKKLKKIIEKLTIKDIGITNFVFYKGNLLDNYLKQKKEFEKDMNNFSQIDIDNIELDF